MTIQQEQVVVVGAGVAGCTAALAAARNGLRVTLVDEHPQNTTSMSLDAPYFYGARLVSVLSDEATIADRVLGSNDLLMDCLEAGVEVITNTCVWGVFVPGENTQNLSGKQVGLADAEKSWMLGFDYLVLATGARDLVLSFPNWELPGVLGVKAATTLLGKYQALGGNELVVLGSGNIALQFALQAIEAGVNIVGIVEPAATVQGDSALASTLKKHSVQFFLNTTVVAAIGKNEVSGIRLVGLGVDKETIDLSCDTICMAYGAVPNIELAAVARCSTRFDASLGGWVPQLTQEQATSVDGVYVIGDASGIDEAALIHPEVAISQAYFAVASILGLEKIAPDFQVQNPDVATSSTSSYPPNLWLDSLVEAAGLDVVACQCEEVTRRQLLSVNAPRYLHVEKGSPDDALAKLIVKGSANQDMHKRMTRVGMGHCQGRRCREHSSMLLAGFSNLPLSAVLPGSYRIPVRLLSIAVMTAHDEPASMGDRWPYWLNPVEDIAPHREPER